MTEPGVREPPLDELRSLVVAAFEQARRTKGTDWYLMRAAVLKNRLLQLTNREFEVTFGPVPIRTLMERIPDVVRIYSTSPVVYEFLHEETPHASLEAESLPLHEEASDSGPAITDWASVRIRDDLWRAILDYSSPQRVVWDTDANIARQKDLMDSPSLPELPTLSPEELASWRQDYVDSVRTEVSSDEADSLNLWIKRGGPLVALPKRLRGRWLELLKRRVAVRITEWFEANSIELPADLYVRAESRGRTADSPTIDAVVQTRRLRALLVDLLENMTYEEMSSIQLPASVFGRLNVRLR